MKAKAMKKKKAMKKAALEEAEGYGCNSCMACIILT